MTMMRWMAASLLYFAIVIAVGFLLGPLSVLWLEPQLGKTIAVLCELPLLLVAMILAARWVLRKTKTGNSNRAPTSPLERRCAASQSLSS